MRDPCLEARKAEGEEQDHVRHLIPVSAEIAILSMG